jgi:hypothetical protein
MPQCRPLLTLPLPRGAVRAAQTAIAASADGLSLAEGQGRACPRADRTAVPASSRTASSEIGSRVSSS